MQFELSDEERMIQEMAAKFAVRELRPRAAELDRTQDRGILLANLKKLADLGFMGLTIRAEYGGSETTAVAFSLAMTELGKGCAATTVTTSVTNMVGEVIQSVGTEEQRRRYLPPLVSGEYPAGGFGLTEATAGSDPAGMRTTARLDGGHWVLNGRKIFISSGEFAGVFVVWAVTDSEAPKGKGISVFLVEPGFPGFAVGKNEPKMGQKGSPTNELILEDCRVPKENLLGELNGGYRLALAELAGGRIGIGSMALGIGLGAMDYAKNYAKEREQFGYAHRPISSDPVDARQPLHRAGGRPPAFAPGGPPQGSGGALFQRGFHGQALCQRGGQPGLLRRRADPGRLRLFPGIPGGAVGPGRAGDHHLRGHQRDSTHDHCPGITPLT